MSKKRVGYLEWDEYFMGVAFLAAQRSKDPSTQVGACIVNPQRKIVGIGYNGFPIGCSDDELPWSKTAADRLDTKYPYVCHAELNAIINKNSSDVRGCTMYVTLFPCNECAKLSIQAGLAKIIYLSDKHHNKPEMVASRKLFDMVGLKYERFVPKRDQIVIDYESGKREEMERSMLVESRSNSCKSIDFGNDVNELAKDDGDDEELAPVQDALDDGVELAPVQDALDDGDELALVQDALDESRNSPRPFPDQYLMAKESYVLNARILAALAVNGPKQLASLHQGLGVAEEEVSRSVAFLKQEGLLVLKGNMCSTSLAILNNNHEPVAQFTSTPRKQPL